MITYGLNFQERTKDLLKANARSFEHWAVCEDGIIRDCFKSQTKIIHTKITDFCTLIMSNVNAYDAMYYEVWKKLDEYAVLPELPYSNFSVIGSFLKVIPIEENKVMYGARQGAKYDPFVGAGIPEVDLEADFMREMFDYIPQEPYRRTNRKIGA